MQLCKLLYMNLYFNTFHSDVSTLLICEDLININRVSFYTNGILALHNVV